MNKVVLVGRLTADPEIRIGTDITIARFNVAVARRYKQEGGQSADFPRVVAFGNTAKFIGDYFKKGMKIGIDGRIQTGEYTDETEKKHYTTEVIAESVEFVESKKVEDLQPNNGEWAEVPADIENDLPFKG